MSNRFIISALVFGSLLMVNKMDAFIISLVSLPFKALNSRVGWATGGAVAALAYKHAHAQNPPKDLQGYSRAVVKDIHEMALKGITFANHYYIQIKTSITSQAQDETRSMSTIVRHINQSLEDIKQSDGYKALLESQMFKDACLVVDYSQKRYQEFIAENEQGNTAPVESPNENTSEQK